MAETLLDMAPGVSSVPQSAPQGSGGSTDMDAILRSIVTPIDPALIKAASMPIAGSHVAGVPSSLTTPIAPHQNMPFNNSEVVGRHNAKMRGIGNAITGVTNALGTVVNKEAQQKQGQIKDAATKVIMAQQGIDEAKQALEAAHGDNAEVQKATQLIQQNQQARDAIFADPKMRKALVKGFDISYTDPQSNKTENHEAVKAAMAQAKTFQEKKEAAQQARQKYNEQQGAGAGAAFEKSAPQGMQPNVQAQQQLAVAQATQKANVEATRAIVPLLVAQARANSAASLEQRRELHTDALALMKSQDSWARMQAQINARQDLAKTQFGYRLREISAEGSKELAVFKQKLSDKNADPLTQVKAYQDFQVKTATTQASLAKHIADLQTQREGLVRLKNTNPQVIKTLDDQIEVEKQSQTAFNDSVTGLSTWYEKLAGKGDSSNGAGSSTGSSLSSASTYLTDTAADPDDEDSY